MQKYYQNYHKHTSYSHIYPKFKDSVVTVEDYLNAMLPLAQKGYPQIYSTLEHGYQGVWTHCLNAIEHFNDEHKNDTANYEPIRFVYGIEGYFVENHADKDDTNNHIVLLAKNLKGMKALNKANAKTFISNETIESGNAKLFFNYNGTEPYFYKRNRYDLELLLSLPPEDVMVTTACVGFWGYSTADNRLIDTTKTDEIILKLHNHFKGNFFLEVQANKSQLQKEINLHILELSKKYGIEIISATDSHGITNDNLIEKKELIKSTNKGKLFYDNGDDFYEDFPSVEELYKRFKEQGVLSDAEIERAIANTNKILDFEKIEIDRSLKVPSIKELKGKPQIEKNKFLQNIINKEYKRQYDDMNHDKKDEYLEAIKYEFSEIEKCNMADYFIDDYYIVQKGLANGGIITDTGRGSAPSFYINKLLGLTKVDRINSVVKLYPERFMTATRILDSKTPPDIDNNVADREPFIKAQRELMGNLSSFDLIAVGKLKLKSAFKMLARAKDINPQLANKITKQIDSYELAKKHSESEVDITKFVDSEYLSLLKECDRYLGIVDSFSPHPCACSLYDGDMVADYGVIRLKSTQKGSKENFCCLLESSTMDSYGIVKNDWLVADSIALIQEIYDEIGIERPTINELLGLIEHDEKTWDIYAKGITNTVNQVEQAGTRKKAELFKPKNIYELTQFVAGVRPSFKSMLKIFLNREHFDYNIPSLDKLLQDKYCDSSFILYQEQIMSVLAFADFEMAETYTIIKAISKKKDYVINGAKERFIPNFAKKCLEHKEVDTMEQGIEVSNKVWQIVENSASYGFNASHAYSYALDSVHLAYLKANYPYEFYKVCLQHYTDKNNKDKVIALTKEMKNFYGISLANMTFGEDNRQFAINRKEHEILQTMKSLKGIQENSPVVLYELGKKKYDSFLDLWLDMKQYGLNKTTMETLASLNYFKQFGTEIDILSYYKLFDLFKGSSKSLFKKTFKKDNEQFQPMFKYMKPFVTKETKANYICDGTQHDMIIELCKHLKHRQTPPILKWLWETRYLGNTDITIPCDDLYYITSIDKTSFGTTFFNLIKLSTNESVTYKVDKKYFETFPTESDVIISANIIYKDKWKKVDNKFVKTGKQEQVIKSYRYKCGKK
jgi:DNA polymerase III alpha subunit